MPKKKVIFFALIVAVSFVLLTYQSTRTGGQQFPVALYPLKVLEQGSSALMALIRNYVFVWGKDDEKRRLLEELDKIRQERDRSNAAQQENDRLRALLQLRSERTDYVTSADVFARDPTNWFQIIWINKGSDFGIHKDMVAVTPFGISGKIHKVLNGSSSIILVTDVNSSVAVRLETSRVEGMLEGTGSQTCYLKYVPKDLEVAVGENVMTSGLDGIYPEGLRAGVVTKVERDSEEVFQVIEVRPAQDMNRIEEVAVLKR